MKRRYLFAIVLSFIISTNVTFAADNSHSEDGFDRKQIIQLLRDAGRASIDLYLKLEFNGATVHVDGADFKYVTGKYCNFDQVMKTLGKYFSKEAAEVELKRLGIIIFNNKPARIMADGEGGWCIDENSKFEFLFVNHQKLFVRIYMINEYNAERYYFYTLRKSKGQWTIDDEADEFSTLKYEDNWVSIRASSEHFEERGRYCDIYFARFVMDHDPNTAWVEGKQGAGVGEWIDFAFGKEAKIKAINIINGYAKSNNHYFDNNRVKKVKIQFGDGTSMVKELQDVMLEPQRVELPEEKTVDRVRLTILEVYPGAKYNDTCISEVGFE